MSSRSIGVMKVVFSFLTISWVTWSPACSTSLILWVLARVGEVVAEVVEQRGGVEDVLGLLLEIVVEADFLRDQAEHGNTPECNRNVTIAPPVVGPGSRLAQRQRWPAEHAASRRRPDAVERPRQRGRVRGEAAHERPPPPP